MEFRVQVPGGELVGWEAGKGDPALILHGGPATDNTDTLVPLLPRSLRTIRYQQRGLAPSTKADPYDVDTHVADAVRVLESRGVDQAWLVGHSWGGHLAFHVAAGHPDRVRGILGIDALGAVPDGGWGALDGEIFERFRRDAPEAAERAREIDERAMAGEGTDEEALESLELVWPYYFASPETAPPMPPTEVNVPLYAAVVASVNDHFARGTLERALPRFGGPVTLIHGLQDPLPAEASRQTAGLFPRAEFVPLEDCGHVPWLEQPEAFRAAAERAFSAG